MNAAFVYILRNLGRRRLRTALGALGIFITIGLLTSIQCGLDSVSLSFIDLVELQAGRADLLLSRADSDPLNPQSFEPTNILAQLSQLPEWRGFSARLTGVVQIQAGGEEHYAVLVAVDPAREKELGIFGLTEDVRLGGTNCAVSQSLAGKLKLAPKAHATLRSPVSFSETGCEISGILKSQYYLPQQVRDFIVTDIRFGQTLLGEDQRTHFLAGGLRDPRRFYDARDLHGSVQRLKNLGAEVSALVGPRFDVRLPKASAITAFQEATSPLRAFFGVFALLVLLITGLLIYSLISLGVEERVREYAILRTLGARQKAIFGIVLGESVLLCSLGILPGIAAGLLFTRAVLSLFLLAAGARGMSLPAAITPQTFWFIVATGVLLALGSALVPAIRATRWRIVDALDPLRRGQLREAAPEDTPSTRPLIVTGLIISILSVIVFFVLPAALFSGNPSLIGTVVLCLLLSMVLGFSLAGIGLIPWTERVLMVGLRGPLGAVAELVSRNLQRYRRRHTTTALLFTLSVALVLFIASLVALFSRSAMSLVEQTYGADLRVHAFADPESGLRDTLKQVKDVQAVSRARFLRSRSEGGIAYDVILSDLVGMKQLWMVPFGVDEDLHRVLYREQLVMDSGDPNAIASLAASSGTGPATTNFPPIVLSLAAANFLEVRPGDPVQLSFRLGSERKDGRFRVAAICRTLPGFPNFRGRIALAVGSGALISQEMFARMTAAAPQEAFQAFYFIRTSPGAGAQKAVAQHIRDDYDLRYRFSVQSTVEQKESARVVYWATQIFFGLLLTVAVAIAVFALMASMAAAVLERRTEIGILKALGLRRRELFKLFYGEAVVLTLSAGITGGAIGFLLAWLFVTQAAILAEIAIMFTMPYLTFVATVGVSLMAGVLAAYIPTRNLLRKTAAEILRG